MYATDWTRCPVPRLSEAQPLGQIFRAWVTEVGGRWWRTPLVSIPFNSALPTPRALSPPRYPLGLVISLNRGGEKSRGVDPTGE